MSGNSTNVTTQKTDNTTFTFNGSEYEKKYLDYPGGLSILGAHASFEKAGDSASDKEYDATFDLQISYKNDTNTDLVWALYVKDSSGLEGDAIDPKCKLIIDSQSSNTEVRYWYGNDDETAGDASNNKNCTLSKTTIESLSSTTPLAYGFLKKNTKQTQTITKDTQANQGSNENLNSFEELTSTYAEDPQELYDPNGTNNNLGSRKLSTKADAGTKDKYYYLVVQYPNNADQTSDEGHEIEVALKVDGQNIITTEHAD